MDLFFHIMLQINHFLQFCFQFVTKSVVHVRWQIELSLFFDQFLTFKSKLFDFLSSLLGVAVLAAYCMQHADTLVTFFFSFFNVIGCLLFVGKYHSLFLKYVVAIWDIQQLQLYFKWLRQCYCSKLDHRMVFYVCILKINHQLQRSLISLQFCRYYIARMSVFPFINMVSYCSELFVLVLYFQKLLVVNPKACVYCYNLYLL